MQLAAAIGAGHSGRNNLAPCRPAAVPVTLWRCRPDRKCPHCGRECPATTKPIGLDLVIDVRGGRLEDAAASFWRSRRSENRRGVGRWYLDQLEAFREAAGGELHRAWEGEAGGGKLVMHWGRP